MEKRNSKLEHGQPMEQTQVLFCMCNSCVARLCGSLSITTPVTLLATELDVPERIAWASELGSCQSNLCNS